MILFFPQAAMKAARCLLLLAVASHAGIAQSRTARERLKSPGTVRPAVTVQVLHAPPEIAAVLDAECAHACRDQLMGERWFVNEIGGIIAPEEPSVRVGQDTIDVITDWARRSDLAIRTMDYLWSVDTITWTSRTTVLDSLARYSISTDSARQLMRTSVGLGRETMAVLTNLYYVILRFDGYGERAFNSKNLLGQSQREVEAQGVVQAFVYRIDWSDVDAAMAAYNPLICVEAEHCSSDEQRKRRIKFRKFRPPLKFVGRFALDVVGSGTNDKDVSAAREAARVAFADRALTETVDEVARLVPAFAVGARVVRAEPVAANIGRKEGVVKGRRYEARRKTADASGAERWQRVGFVRANRVADNRRDAATNHGEGEVLAANDSTTFTQTFGRAIVPRLDELYERPDLGVGLYAGYWNKDLKGPTLGVEWEPMANAWFARTTPWMPLGARVRADWIGLGAAQVGTVSAVLSLVSAGAGFERLLARGRFRLGVDGGASKLVLTLSAADSRGNTESASYNSPWGAFVGVGATLYLTPALSADVRWRHVAFVVDGVNDAGDTEVTSLRLSGFRLGVKYAR